jgi:peptide/nickel transport system permease protein
VKRLGLGGYVARRAVYSVVLVVGAVILVFFLTHVITPNPAALWAGPRAPPSVVQAVVLEYHLNQPVHLQLLYYLEDIFTFNFGISPFFRQPVASLISVYFPRTLELSFFAMVITVVLGIATGAFGAAHQDRKGDYGVRGIYLVSWSMPPFLVALLLQLFFAYQWNLFPSSLLADPTLTPPRAVTGLPILDSLIAGDYLFLNSTLIHLVLPALSLALISFGLITRITRSSMLESLRADYVRTAVMKGIGTRRAVYIHALKNSLLPVITVIALTFSYVIAGAVVVEVIFSYEGMGYLITQSVYNYDYPTLIGSTIVVVVAVVVINFVADVLYAVVDPRIRLGG